MTEIEIIIEEFRKMWPAGAVVLVFILAYIGARKISSPMDWANIRNLLWNKLKLSLDISATKITTPDTVLITLGYFRKKALNHDSDCNSLLLDIYDNCMKHYCCFWWHDRVSYIFMVLIFISIPLFKLAPVLAGVCGVAYFGITLLTGDKAKEIEKKVIENTKESRDTQISHLDNTRSNYYELS